MSQLSFNEAKQIAITDYLNGLGFEPSKIRGSDSWYYSPFRDERTASFKVDTKLNLWYDHGSGEGGTILDLGAKLHQCTLKEFLEKLTERNYSTIQFHFQPHTDRINENKLEVLSVKPLLDSDLLYYLSTRGISKVTARSCCKEVDFQIKQKQYKAIGFPNRSGGYELRNSWFKGSSSPKDVSFIDNHSDRISVLEGFIDFLSVQELSEMGAEGLKTKTDFLILNSLRLLKRSLPILQSYKEISLFLDNDHAAHDSKKILTENGIVTADSSHLYSGHKDVNDFLKHTIQQAKEHQRPRRRSIR